MVVVDSCGEAVITGDVGGAVVPPGVVVARSVSVGGVVGGATVVPSVAPSRVEEVTGADGEGGVVDEASSEPELHAPSTNVTASRDASGVRTRRAVTA